MEKKQTAMQTLIAWGDKMLLEHPQKILSFAEVIDKAEELLQMERVQIIEAYAEGSNDRLINRINQQYYKETYGKETDRS